MNKTDIMKLLTLLKANHEPERIVTTVIEHLEHELKQLNLKAKGQTPYKQHQAAVKFLKKASGRNIRPILSYVDIQDGLQCFTDSYVAFRFKNHIEDLPSHEDKLGGYPSLSEYIPKASDCEAANLDYQEVLRLCDLMKVDKAKKLEEAYVYTVSSSSTTVMLDPRKVKEAITILADQPANIKLYICRDKALFVDSYGDEALVVGVRFDL